MEKVTVGGTTTFKHFIHAGEQTVALYSRDSTGTNTRLVPLHDHLGSVDALYNSDGTLKVRESFDAFGKRRDTDWNGAPSATDAALIAGTTRRGFTEHEHLDSTSIVHMNGRIYDPNIGRFLSPDPLADCVTTPQGGNRYSYVRNNPLSATDPSGFEEISGEVVVHGSRIVPMTANQGGRGIQRGKGRPGGGDRHGDNGDSDDEEMQEVTLTASTVPEVTLPPPPILPLAGLNFVYTKPMLLVRLELIFENRQMCLDKCRQFGMDGIVDPIGEVGGGAAGGGYWGAFAGAVTAFMKSQGKNEFLANGFSAGTSAYGERNSDGRSTPRSRSRAARASVTGSLISSASAKITDWLGLSDKVTDTVNTLAGIADSGVAGYLDSRWARKGPAGRVAGGVKGVKDGVKGAVVSELIGAAGSAITDAACELNCPSE